MKCSKCNGLVSDLAKFCHHCGNKFINEKVNDSEEWECEYCGEGFATRKDCLKHEKNCSKIGRKITHKSSKLKYILLIIGIIAFIIIFLIPFPYQVTEEYTVQEPYQDSYTECVDRSWWSGNCVDYDTKYVTRYRQVSKTRVVTKSTTLYKMWSGQVSYYYKV